MNKLVLSVLVVGALIGGHMVRATDEPTSGAAGGEEFNNEATAELIDAARHGNLAAVQAAITAGADVNVKDVFYGETPLHYAACNGHLPVVQCLLAAGADVNAQTKRGLTPLHYAAVSGHLPVVECLLTAGADVNAKTKHGATPLHFAAESGHLPVVQYLIALPQVDLTLKNSDGETAQEQARRWRRDEIADAIDAEIAARRRRWSPLRKAFIGAVGLAGLGDDESAKRVAAASAALDALLAEGDGAPASAAGGGGGASAGPGDDKSGCEEHKE